MTQEILVDAAALREQVRLKYGEVAVDPGKDHHFHIGRSLARILGYPQDIVDSLPDAAVESFAGTANLFSLEKFSPGEKVVDAGSGAGFDSFVAAGEVGHEGFVVGVDMTPEMLAKSRSTAEAMGTRNVEFRDGLLEDMPVEDGWADVVMSNGVFNLCADKKRVFAEVFRILRPGGRLQFADIAVGKQVPEGAQRNIDLWTA